MTPEERQALIAELRDFPQVFEDTLNAVPEELLTTKVIPGEWTIAQVLHHLADAHMNAFIRLKLILVEDYPTFKPYEQEDWAETPEASDMFVPDSLAILRGLHHRWSRLMQAMDESQWQRKGLHPELGEISTEELLTGYVRHSHNHFNQIMKTLNAFRTH